MTTFSASAAASQASSAGGGAPSKLMVIDARMTAVGRKFESHSATAEDRDELAHLRGEQVNILLREILRELTLIREKSAR